MSDWSETIKPIASKLYAELSKTHGDKAGALVEALEIARRRAEIDQTELDWRKRHGCVGNCSGVFLLASAGQLFKSLCAEFGPQRAVHILTGIEREHSRAAWGTDMKAWRQKFGNSVDDAAHILGIASEDVTAIEDGTLCAGPQAMRLIRPALRIVRFDLHGESNEVKM